MTNNRSNLLIQIVALKDLGGEISDKNHKVEQNRILRNLNFKLSVKSSPKCYFINTIDARNVIDKKFMIK